VASPVIAFRCADGRSVVQNGSVVQSWIARPKVSDGAARMTNDRSELESKWQANERELQRLAAMSPLDRELHAKREDDLLDEQDLIEFQLGFEGPTSSRRWSGMA
jgi:hypothetical protein